MNWVMWLTYCALAVCLASIIFHITRLLKLGFPKDYSVKSGNTDKAIFYAFTGAMNPKAKESAFLHLPTYLLGILYHLGTFVSIPLFFLFLFELRIPQVVTRILAVFILITALSGFTILIKRIALKKLSSLSNPDDYISNILVSLFQLVTVFYLLHDPFRILYFIIASCLLLYLPIGKLRHAIYFFSARIHLGFFYGWRGVWPPVK